MLKTIWYGISAILEMLTTLVDTITKNVRGMLAVIKLVWRLFVVMNEKIFDFVKTPLGIVGVIFVAGAVIVFAGAIWEAVN